jgi:hypothetical protein
MTTIAKSRKNSINNLKLICKILIKKMMKKMGKKNNNRKNKKKRSKIKTKKPNTDSKLKTQSIKQSDGFIFKE